MALARLSCAGSRLFFLLVNFTILAFENLCVLLFSGTSFFQDIIMGLFVELIIQKIKDMKRYIDNSNTQNSSIILKIILLVVFLFGGQTISSGRLAQNEKSC